MRKQIRILKRFFKLAIDVWLPVRKKPFVIQMPITSRCNSRCVTCNVWRHRERIDIDDVALKKALEDPFFSEVKAVGLNGGEFSLVPHFKEILDALTSLPRLKNVYFISNGIAGQRIIEYMRFAKEFFSERGIYVSLCVSIDGYGKTHDKVRGIEGNFVRSMQLIEELSKNQSLYCDQLSLGYTLSRYNVDRVFELDSLSSQFNVPIDIHLAVPNKRIGTYSDADRYSVLADEGARQLAAEFFFSRFLETRDYRMKARYYSNYYYLSHHGKGRLSDCLYRFRDITIDENLNLSLCATASESIGNLKSMRASDIIKNSKTGREAHRLLRKCCNYCIHYSYYPLTIKGRFLFAFAVEREQNSMNMYKSFCKKRRPIATRLISLKRVIKIALRNDY